MPDDGNPSNLFMHITLLKYSFKDSNEYKVTNEPHAGNEKPEISLGLEFVDEDH